MNRILFWLDPGTYIFMLAMLFTFGWRFPSELAKLKQSGQL